MRRVKFLPVGWLLAALLCAGGDKKPPMVPDTTEQSVLPIESDAGAPSPEPAVKPPG